MAITNLGSKPLPKPTSGLANVAQLRDYQVRLQSAVSTSFFCQKAANSLDIDTRKKSVHELNVSADITSPYHIGLIVGASGSGKTTLIKSIFGEGCLNEVLDLALPVIDQFGAEFDYDQRAAMLSGVGLTQVVCWIRPAYTLSNGQRARAECALQMARQASANQVVAIDEWTSVVDRTVAKVMSFCIQKHARRFDKRIVLCSCHYDVIDWLNPDWVIDCNKQTYQDRRSLQSGFQRAESLRFDIRPVGRETWRYFSKYHYLSERLPGGAIETFGLFHNDDQIGFQCYANYVPWPRGSKGRKPMHSNRVVIHPDYAGLGLGMRLIDETSHIMWARGFQPMAKMSSVPIFKARQKSPYWILTSVKRDTKVVTGRSNKAMRFAHGKAGGYRLDVKTYSYVYVPPAPPSRQGASGG